MLTAQQTGTWKNNYEISVDGRPLVEWDANTWSVGGSFTLEDRQYDVRANILATRYEMTDQTGTPVAVADRVGRKHWTVEADGRTHAFERGSIWRLEERFMVDGEQAGMVRRARLDSGEASADLPGLSLPAQVFVLLVVLAGWDLAAAASG